MDNWYDLFKTLLAGDYKNFFIDIFATKATDATIRAKISECFEEFLKKQCNVEIAEQMKEMINDLKNPLEDGIADNNLNILDEIGRELDECMRECGIEESRSTIVDNFKCSILYAVSELDTNFFNILHLNIDMKELQQKVKNMLAEIQKMHEYKTIFQKNKNLFECANMNPHIDDSSKFIARDIEIKHIKETFDAGGNIIFLCGRPGMGKTSLAKMFMCRSDFAYKLYAQYTTSFEDTIRSLASNPKSTSGEEILRFWGNNTETAEKTLLVIDNFNPAIFTDEFSYKEELKKDFYKRLLETGVKIIVVTRIDLERNTLKIGAVSNPMELFKNYYEFSISDEEVGIIEDIIDIVHQNTLLIILAADTLRRNVNLQSKMELLQRLKNCSMHDDNIQIPVRADIDNVDEQTLYNQVKAMLDMSGIRQSEYWTFFENAVLLPMEGLKRDIFLKLVGDNDENKLQRLINGAWIIQEGEIICVHPLVREIVLTEFEITYADCCVFCENVAENIATKNDFESRIIYKHCAEEIYNIFGCREVLDVELVKLIYALSDIYDELGERTKSKELVDCVLRNIYLFEDYPIDEAEILSGIAYSWNNCFDDMKILDAAEEKLWEAKNILDNLTNQRKSYRYVIVFAKVLNNFGSNYLARSKCNLKKKRVFLDEAIKAHEKALEYRQRYEFFFDDEDKRKQISLGIAKSYTALAIDNFFLEDYGQAISYHQTALKIREKYNDLAGMDINKQRIIGCVIEWYRAELGITIKYIELAIHLYPDLLEENFRLQDYNALNKNIENLLLLRKIIVNDKRLDSLVDQMNDICNAVVEWCADKHDIKVNYRGLKG